MVTIDYLLIYMQQPNLLCENKCQESYKNIPTNPCFAGYSKLDLLSSKF